MGMAFVGLFFISFSYKQNNTFSSLKVEHLEIVNGTRTVLELGTTTIYNDYPCGYIEGYGYDSLTSHDNRIFRLSGEGRTKSGFWDIYTLDKDNYWFSNKDRLLGIRNKEGASIEFYNQKGILSKIIKAE